VVEDGLPDRGQARLRRRAGDSFFPPRCLETAGLEEGVGDHSHECVSVQAAPGAHLAVIEAASFLDLLMRLLADPSCLDGSAELSHRRVGWQVAEVVFFARRWSDVHRPARLSRQACAGLPCCRCAANGRVIERC